MKPYWVIRSVVTGRYIAANDSMCMTDDRKCAMRLSERPKIYSPVMRAVRIVPKQSKAVNAETEQWKARAEKAEKTLAKIGAPVRMWRGEITGSLYTGPIGSHPVTVRVEGE
jgi:hypothetical protein